MRGVALALNMLKTLWNKATLYNSSWIRDGQFYPSHAHLLRSKNKKNYHLEFVARLLNIEGKRLKVVELVQLFEEVYQSFVFNFILAVKINFVHSAGFIAGE